MNWTEQHAQKRRLNFLVWLGATVAGKRKMEYIKSSQVTAILPFRATHRAETPVSYIRVCTLEEHTGYIQYMYISMVCIYIRAGQ